MPLFAMRVARFAARLLQALTAVVTLTVVFLVLIVLTGGAAQGASRG